jgi:L-methionine (R)-S-oxide reductase
MQSSKFAPLLAQICDYAGKAKNLEALQEFTVKLIAKELTDYNWVGFYMLDPDDPQILVLGPFCGTATPHVRIPVSQGICGAAVAQEQTVIVDDVSSDPRYLSCSLETRSEIVVPIRVHGRIAGEIDIDSHSPAAFTQEDRRFLEACADEIGAYIERLSA